MKITQHNYEEFLIDYLHGELNPEQCKEVEIFLQANPQARAEFELFQQTQSQPEEHIIFEKKTSLLKSENKSALSISFKKVLALAAMLTGIIIALFLVNKPNQPSNPDVVVNPSTPFIKVQPTITPIEDTMKHNSPVMHPSPIRQINAPVLVHTKPKANLNKPSILTKLPKVTKSIQSTNEPFVQQRIETPQEPLQEELVKIPQEEPPTNVIREEPYLVESQQLPPIAASQIDKRTIVFNEQKQPKLFKIINQTTRFFRKAKDVKATLANSEVTVMVGNFKILNLN